MLILPFLFGSGYWLSRYPSVWKRVLIGGTALCLIACVAENEYRVCGVVLNIAVLAALLLRWKDAKYRLALLVVFVGAVATTASSFYMSNYFLPYVAAVILLIVVGLRNLSMWDRRRGTGASLAGVLMLGCLAMVLLQVGAGVLKHPRYGESDLGRFDFPAYRLPAEIVAQLRPLPGRHLVLVRMSRGFAKASTHELVWNLADIDDQRIVWARDERPEWTATAVNYYKDRRIWLADVTDRGWHLTAYPVGELPPTAPLSALPMPDKDIALQ